MSWYALYTRPRHEKRVYQELTADGIEAFLPILKVRRRWSDRYKVVDEPLFKNYLFVNVENPAQDGSEILRHYGTVAFVTFDGKPAQIPSAEIDSIRRLVDSELAFGPHPYLKTGRKVRIRSGPLEGCEGFFIRKKRLGWFVLSINLLQQSVTVEVDADAVEAV